MHMNAYYFSVKDAIFPMFIVLQESCRKSKFRWMKKIKRILVILIATMTISQQVYNIKATRKHGYSHEVCHFFKILHCWFK